MRLPYIGHLTDAKTVIPHDQWEPLPCWCGADSDDYVTGRAGDGTRMDLWRCLGYGTMRVSPYPSDAALAAMYSNYEHDSNYEYRRAANQAWWLYNQAWWAHGKGVNPNTILDIGCGRGDSLRMWKTMWPMAAQVTGVDSDAAAVAAARGNGHDVWTSMPHTKFDLVVLSHVLEHLRDPVGMLIFAALKLTPGGCILAEVPLVKPSPLNWRWIYQTELSHCWYFGRDGFEALIRRAGFSSVVYNDREVVRALARP